MIPHVLERLQYSRHLLKHLKSHYVLPNVDSHLVTYHPWVANNRQSQHWGRREEVPTGKSWISWLKRRDMKNLTFSLVFQRNLKSILAITVKSHNGSCYHRTGWQMFFHSPRRSDCMVFNETKQLQRPCFSLPDDYKWKRFQTSV